MLILKVSLFSVYNKQRNNRNLIFKLNLDTRVCLRSVLASLVLTAFRIMAKLIKGIIIATRKRVDSLY